MKQFVDSSQPIVIVRKRTKPIEGEERHRVISGPERQPNFQLGNKEYIWRWRAGEIAQLSKCSCGNDYCLITQRWKNKKIKWHRLYPPGNRWGKGEEYGPKACKYARGLLCRPPERTSVLIWDCANVLSPRTPLKINKLWLRLGVI